ncbi:MAG: tetratricopeptide repeat protein [Candidatus Viridilinea halotolerans]|uniref:Tetratricopeptide repeat protein n=1 Tax=Candidatus Viridilinea halotolerans TaxID=2491704 RepID=A0A426U301_9CHLR|nr:MAG: tetratricopeptide repeat protein [Candidatus Viridilinea halotolerans]
MQVLAQLGQSGWMLRGPVERIWVGERDRAALVASLDEQDAALIERVLELIHTPASVAQVPLPPAPPDVVLSPSILAALASNDAAQLEAALAILAPDERTRVEAQLRAEAERVMQELTRRSSEEIVAGLPAAVRAALEQQDSDAIQAAMAALADNDRQRVMVDLGALRAHAVRAAQQQQQDPLERFAPLLEAIAAVANGDDAPRKLVTQTLAQLEQNGWMLRGPVERIWAGERDRAALVAGLDEQDAALIERMLELIHTPASVAQVPLPPAPPDVVLSPSILAALASNDVAQLKAALAALAPDERTRVEAQLRAEAERVMQELTPRSPEEIVAGLPAAVRAALQQQDNDAFQLEMGAFAEEERPMPPEAEASPLTTARAGIRCARWPALLAGAGGVATVGLLGAAGLAPLLAGLGAGALATGPVVEWFTSMGMNALAGWVGNLATDGMWAVLDDDDPDPAWLAELAQCLAAAAASDQALAAELATFLKELDAVPLALASIAEEQEAQSDVLIEQHRLLQRLSADMERLKLAGGALGPVVVAESDRVIATNIDCTKSHFAQLRAELTAIRDAQRHAIDVLHRVESIALLRQHRPELLDAEADALAAELGDLPLALHLAGRFLADLAKCWSVDRYLAELRSSRLFDRLLLLERGGTLPTDHNRDVARSFALSYERLELQDAEDALALKLLARAAHLVPGEVLPTALLLATIAQPVDDADGDRLAEAALDRLVALGLIEREGDDSLRMHRLVGAYVRHVSADGEAQSAVEQVVIRVAGNMVDVPILATLNAFIPILRGITDAALGREDARVVSLCSWIGRHLQRLGSYASAQPYVERALALSEQVLGAEHPDTAQSLNNLAWLYRVQGNYGAALPLYERALPLSEQVLGADHPQTVQVLTNLAWLYEAQGNYGAALPLYERALPLSEHVLGVDHPQTVIIFTKLAGLYEAQGNYDAALPLSQRALVIYERVLGVDHPQTVISLINLAGLYCRQENYEAALPLAERALPLSEQVLGGDHSQTFTILLNLAWLYREQRNYEAALPLYERTLEICERVWGVEHPQTIQRLTGLAGLYEEQENYGAALPLYERALAIREQVLGAEHPDTAQSLNNLAWLYRVQGNYGAALPLYERALPLSEHVLGADHPQTVEVLTNLAWLYRAQGNYGAALPLSERALAIREQVLGAEHPDTATSLNNLAGLYEAQGNYGAALPLYERALAIRERVLGAEHPGVATSLNNLAVLHAHRGGFVTAIPLIERALNIRQRTLGGQHPDTLATEQSLVNMRRAAQQQQQDPLERFVPLLAAIAAVAKGDDAPREQVTQALTQLEQNGWMLRGPVERIWAGERARAMLVAGLDEQDAALIERVLRLL